MLLKGEEVRLSFKKWERTWKSERKMHVVRRSKEATPDPSKRWSRTSSPDQQSWSGDETMPSPPSCRRAHQSRSAKLDWRRGKAETPFSLSCSPATIGKARAAMRQSRVPLAVIELASRDERSQRGDEAKPSPPSQCRAHPPQSAKSEWH